MGHPILCFSSATFFFVFSIEVSEYSQSEKKKCGQCPAMKIPPIRSSTSISFSEALADSYLQTHRRFPSERGNDFENKATS